MKQKLKQNGQIWCNTIISTIWAINDAGPWNRKGCFKEMIIWNSVLVNGTISFQRNFPVAFLLHTGCVSIQIWKVASLMVLLARTVFQRIISLKHLSRFHGPVSLMAQTVLMIVLHQIWMLCIKLYFMMCLAPHLGYQVASCVKVSPFAQQ